jgi:RNA polymerase sigma-70 factor (ECF subfamily)
MPDPVPQLDAGAIFKEYGPFVWRSLRHLGVADRDLPDLSQEVFLIVHRRLETFEGRGTLRSWLYGICHRVTHGHRRRFHVQREQPTEKLPEVEVASAPEDAVQVARTRSKLESALRRLDEPKRQVFVLYEIEQLSMQEIADAIGCPLQTAYSRLHAARKVMFEAFAEGKEDDDG